MKIIQLFKIVLLALFLGSCCNQDDGNPIGNSLSGKWHLVQVSGSFAGINHLFEPGTISWEFDTVNHKFKVVNTNTDEGKQDLFETGTYGYGMQANTATPELCNEVILLNDIDYGCFGIDNDQLIINQIEADGYYIKLIRF